MTRSTFALRTMLLTCCCLLAFTFENLTAQDDKALQNGTLFERIQALEVAMPPADIRLAKVTGVVRKPDYTAAKAVVVCWRTDNDGATVLAKATTDELGRYSLIVVPTFKEYERFQFFAIDADGHLAWSSSYFQEDSNPRLSFVLRENHGRVDGTLVAPGGSPVSGVEVALGAWLEPNAVFGVDFAPFDFRCRSDAEGRFSIDGLPTGVVATFSARSAQWTSLSTLMPTTVDAPIDGLPGYVRTSNFFSGPGKVKIYPKCDVAGTVVDSSDNPVAGASIGFHNDSITNERGEFTISRPDFDTTGPDECKDYFENLQIIPPASSRFVETNIVLRRAELTARRIKPIVLGGAFVSGQILNKNTKQPLPSIRVRSIDRALEVVLSDANGMFRLQVSPGQNVMLFAPPWMTRTEQQNFLAHPNSRGRRDIEVLDGESAEIGTVLLDVDPDEVKSQSIKVISKRRTPISNCRLVLEKLDDIVHRNYQATLVDGDSFAQSIVTNKVGVAVLKPAGGWGQFKRVPPLAPDELDTPPANTVTASYFGKRVHFFGKVNFAEATDEVIELTLTEGVCISGKVLLNGLPLEGVTITATARDADQHSTARSTESDENGEYTIYLPSANEYTLGSMQGFPVENYFATVSQFKILPTDDPLFFIVSPIEFVTGSGEIRGTVVNRDRKPAAGALVGCNNPTNQIWIPKRPEIGRTSSAPTLTAKTDADGNFILCGVPNGTHHLVATDASNSLWRDKKRIAQEVEAESGSKDVILVLP